MERVEPYYYGRPLSILAQNTDDNILLFFLEQSDSSEDQVQSCVENFLQVLTSILSDKR